MQAALVDGRLVIVGPSAHNREEKDEKREGEGTRETRRGCGRPTPVDRTNTVLQALPSTPATAASDRSVK